MTLRTIFILTLVMLMGNLFQAVGGRLDPEPGVPRELARSRAEHYSNVRYALSLQLAKGAEMLRGSEEIRVTLGGAPDQLVLDWRKMPVKDGRPQARAWDVEANGRKVMEARETNDHLIIPGAYLIKGENVIRLKFESPISTSGSAVTRYLDREDKSEYIYTLFVPSDASTAFPCFDQPDLKARFQLTVSAPSEWKVITNTRSPLDSGFPKGFVPADESGELGPYQKGSSLPFYEWTFQRHNPSALTSSLSPQGLSRSLMRRIFFPGKFDGIPTHERRRPEQSYSKRAAADAPLRA